MNTQALMIFKSKFPFPPRKSWPGLTFFRCRHLVSEAAAARAGSSVASIQRRLLISFTLSALPTLMYFHVYKFF